MFPNFHHSWISFQFGCFFTSYFTPWIFSCSGLSSMSNLYILLGAPLCSWWSFSFSITPAFSEGVSKLSSDFSNRSWAILLVCPVQYPQGYLILSPGLWPSDRFSGDASLRILIIAKFLIFLKFSKVFRKIAPRLQVTSQEVCYWTYIFLVSWRRSCWCSPYILSDGIFSVSIFPHVLWEWEDKIEVIEELLVMLFVFFYYRLTLSCSDFEKGCTCKIWIFHITSCWHC